MSARVKGVFAVSLLKSSALPDSCQHKRLFKFQVLSDHPPSFYVPTQERSLLANKKVRKVKFINLVGIEHKLDKDFDLGPRHD